MSGQGAKRMSTGWLGLVIAVAGLVIAILLGWALMAIGANRLDQANKIRASAERRLMTAMGFAAEEAMRDAQQADIAIRRSNWGEAQTRLSRVNELVTLMEQIAPASRSTAVRRLRERLAEAQQLVGNQSEGATQVTDALVTDLDDLRQEQAR